MSIIIAIMEKFLFSFLLYLFIYDTFDCYFTFYFSVSGIYAFISVIE